MLGKALKHEWIATGRRYGLFYMVLLVVTAVAAGIGKITIDSIVIQMVQSALEALYGLTVIAMFFFSFGYAVIRFYQNFVTDEGYLTFTLPAKVEVLVAAKVIVAFLWQIVTIALGILSVGVVFGKGAVLRKFWDAFLESVGRENRGIIIYFIIFLLSVLLYELLVYYLSISLGQAFSNNKIVGAVISYCILSVVVEVVLVAIICIVGAIVGFAEMDRYLQSTEAMPLVFCVGSAWMVLAAGIMYYVSSCLLKKKLNLN